MADKLIATRPLFIGRARAHNPGDEVPAENVEKHGWADGVAEEASQITGLFDPSDHNVDQVLAHLATADEDERDRVLEAELAGKARTGILDA